MNGIKRLFNSYKFFACVFGTGSLFAGAKIFDLDTTVLTIIGGMWMAVIAGQAVKDYAIEIKGKKNGS